MSSIDPISSNLGLTTLSSLNLQGDGNGLAKKRLEELLAQLQASLASLPPDLQTLPLSLVSQVQDATRSGDVGQIQAATSKLTQIQGLIQQYAVLNASNPDASDGTDSVDDTNSADALDTTMQQDVLNPSLDQLRKLLYDPTLGQDQYLASQAQAVDSNAFQSLIDFRFGS